MGWLNFEEQLTFYGQYHNNPWYSPHLIFTMHQEPRSSHYLFAHGVLVLYGLCRPLTRHHAP
jgi:hypothetical protein